MSDPIKDLGRAAEAYIEAAGQDRAETDKAFEAVIGAYGAARESGVLGQEGTAALENERTEWKEASAQLTQSGAAYWQFQRRMEERDFADAAAYFAQGPEEADAQPLRIAVPIPVPDPLLPGDEHAIVDTGRYTLRIKVNEMVRAFDKATGEEQMLLSSKGNPIEDPAFSSVSPGAPAFRLEDGTFVVFAEDRIMVVKYDTQEGDYADAFSFPVDQNASSVERVKVRDFEIAPLGAAADAPDDGTS